jgi:hypothetical protein
MYLRYMSPVFGLAGVSFGDISLGDMFRRYVSPFFAFIRDNRSDGTIGAAFAASQALMGVDFHGADNAAVIPKAPGRVKIRWEQARARCPGVELRAILRRALDNYPFFNLSSPIKERFP